MSGGFLGFWDGDGEAIAAAEEPPGLLERRILTAERTEGMEETHFYLRKPPPKSKIAAFCGRPHIGVT